jgi:hypothetical protein
MRHALLSPAFGACLIAVAVPAVADDIPPPRAAPRRLEVLLIDGSPRWENRYLRTALDRAELRKGKAFGLRSLLLGVDPLLPTQDPQSVTGMPPRGELDHFHLVILGDADPADPRLGEEHLKNLARFVRDGGGLLVVAGPRHTPHDLKRTALADVLPVELGERPAAKKDDVRTDGYRPALTDAGRGHRAFRFDPDPDESRRILAGLPEMYWFADGVKARPGAVVLAAHPTAGGKDGPLPLVAWHAVGKGRCGFVGFDETWRWRRNDGRPHHQTFWVELARSLVPGE